MDLGAGMSVYANLAGLDVGDGYPVRIVGAINVSPESFYKGSVAADESTLRRRGEQMIAEGADMLDVGAMSTARHYPFGTTLSMGPGYFPMVLSGILIAFGIYITLRGLRRNEKIQGSWSIRALVMLPLSIVVFGILMNLAGFVPALVALVFLSSASGRQFKLKEVLLLTIFLTILSVAMFIWGLGLPYPLIKLS